MVEAAGVKFGSIQHRHNKNSLRFKEVASSSSHSPESQEIQQLVRASPVEDNALRPASILQICLTEDAQYVLRDMMRYPRTMPWLFGSKFPCVRGGPRGLPWKLTGYVPARFKTMDQAPSIWPPLGDLTEEDFDLTLQDCWKLLSHGCLAHLLRAHYLIYGHASPVYSKNIVFSWYEQLMTAPPGSDPPGVPFPAGWTRIQRRHKIALLFHLAVAVAPLEPGLPLLSMGSKLEQQDANEERIPNNKFVNLWEYAHALWSYALCLMQPLHDPRPSSDPWRVRECYTPEECSPELAHCLLHVWNSSCNHRTLHLCLALSAQHDVNAVCRQVDRKMVGLADVQTLNDYKRLKLCASFLEVIARLKVGNRKEWTRFTPLNMDHGEVDDCHFHTRDTEHVC